MKQAIWKENNVAEIIEKDYDINFKFFFNLRKIECQPLVKHNMYSTCI